MLTQDTLKQWLRYDHETGIFYWLKKPRQNVSIGDAAGCNHRGYMIITLFRRNYPAHRLAWLYVHGKWPNGHLDHINRNPSHNVIANLREATAAENAYNRKTRRDNRVGLKGVSRTKYGTFKAWIQVNKKPLYLGSYPTPEKAHAAYVAAAQKHFGEFARST